MKENRYEPSAAVLAERQNIPNALHTSPRLLAEATARSPMKFSRRLGGHSVEEEERSLIISLLVRAEIVSYHKPNSNEL
jgi:hypothetical protein